MQEINQNILSINERIIQFVDLLGLTRYRLCKETGISQAVLVNIYKLKNGPSADLLSKLLHKYESLDANWLLRGTGEMFISDEKQPDIHVSVATDKSPPSSPEVSFLINEIKEKDRALRRAYEEIGKLKHIISLVKPQAIDPPD